MTFRKTEVWSVDINNTEWQFVITLIGDLRYAIDAGSMQEGKWLHMPRAYRESLTTARRLVANFAATARDNGHDVLADKELKQYETFTKGN